ncbi:MAG: hypothetical protein AB7K64_08465 [Variibacter sp.]
MQKRPGFLLSHLASAALLAAAATVLAAAPAAAAQRGGGFSCVGSGASVTCTGSYGDRSGNTHVIGVARASDEEAARVSQDREKRWVAYCAPDIVHDRYGVGRYVYAVRGCEFGRYKD